MPDLHVAKITAPTATGNQSYTGFGFQPKAILAFATAQSVEGVQGGAEVGFGMASGASAAQRSAAIAMEDNQTTTKTDRRWDDSLIHTISAGAGAIIIRALVVSFDADGVTLNWTHTLADRIVYLVALGGAEISNAELVLFTAPTDVGTQDVVNAGGFQPDVSVLLTSSLTALGTAAGAKLSLGAAQTTAKRWALAQNARDAQTMTIAVDAIKEQRTDLCLVGLTDAGQDFTADLSTVLSNGIRLNWVDAPASAILCAALMLKGSGAGMFDVGSFAQATGTAPYTQDVATSPNFEPAGVLLASFLAAAAAGLVADAEAMIGAAKNAAIIVESAVWENCEDFTLPTRAAKENLSTKVITNRDSTGVGGQTLLVDQADLDAFLSTGFRLNWGTATTSILEQFLYLAVKKTTAPGVSQTNAQAWESLQQIAPTTLQPWEALQLLVPTALQALESLVLITSTNLQPLEGLQVLRPTNLQPWESRGMVSATVLQPWESLVALAVQAGQPWEVLVLLTRSAVQPWEALALLSPSIAQPWEALQRLALTALQPWENTTFIVVTALQPWESGVRLIVTTLQPWEVLVFLLNTNLQPAEALQQIVQTVQQPLENSSVVMVTALSQWESLKALAVQGVIPWEALQAILFTDVQPWESLLKMLRTAEQPWETRPPVAGVPLVLTLSLRRRKGRTAVKRRKSTVVLRPGN